MVKEEDGRKRPTFASADVCGDWAEGGWGRGCGGGKGSGGEPQGAAGLRAAGRCNEAKFLRTAATRPCMLNNPYAVWKGAMGAVRGQ